MKKKAKNSSPQGRGRSLKPVKKVVLAYSGGLDTSVIIQWLKENYHCEVIAFCADLGQGEDLSEVRKKAIKTGADKVVVEDLREEFVEDFVFPMLRASALYEGEYLLGTSIARPLIAQKQIEVARKEKADAVSHGATGKGNDQVRFELAYLTLMPSIRIIAPWREWNFRSRGDLIDYADAQGIPISATRSKPYSIDRNLFHTSYEGGILEDPWVEPPAGMFLMTVPAEKAPARAQTIEIEFKKGNPVAVDGKKLSPARLLSRLNEVAGRHGIGRVDLVENRYVGMKSRGVYETPGGTLLHKAHRAVESLTLDREAMHLRDSWITRYSELVYYGYWFSPERRMLQAAIDKCQERVEGIARLKLYRGSCQVTGRKSSRSLYDASLATFEEEEVYDQRDAEGFIKLNALRLKIQAGESTR